MAVAVTSRTVLASKFKGCMLGSLIGDCLGAPFEGHPPISKAELKDYFSKMLDNSANKGSAQILKYTDDTCMTFSLAESLVDNNAFDAKDMATRFTNEFYNQPHRGHGAHIGYVFKALKDTNYADVFQPAKLQFNGSGSFGNGAAMRTAPVPLFGYKKGEQFIIELAKECALITHAHENGYNGAILLSLAVYEALKRDSTKVLDPIEFVSILLQRMEQIEQKITFESQVDVKPLCQGLEKIKEIFSNQKLGISAEEIAHYLGNNVSAHGSVPTSIYAFLRGLQPLSEFESSNAFVRTIYLSISFGGDTDTIACMAGSIAGAYHGCDLIPSTMQEKCESLERSISLADKLFEIIQDET